MSDAAATADHVISEAATPQGRDKAAREAKSAASAAVDTAQADASSLADRGQATAEDVRRRMGEASSVARDWAVDQSDVLRDTVQTKPFVSVGVSAASAFAAGLVLGVLLTRR